jgi:hypothetical protein
MGAGGLHVSLGGQAHLPGQVGLIGLGGYLFAETNRVPARPRAVARGKEANTCDGTY